MNNLIRTDQDGTKKHKSAEAQGHTLTEEQRLSRRVILRRQASNRKRRRRRLCSLVPRTRAPEAKAKATKAVAKSDPNKEAQPLASFFVNYCKEVKGEMSACHVTRKKELVNASLIGRRPACSSGRHRHHRQHHHSAMPSQLWE